MMYVQDELLVKLISICGNIISLDDSAESGNAKVPLPRNELCEEEVFGPIRRMLHEVRPAVSSWARRVNLNGKVWISGSIVDGVSPVKGLFQGSEFVAYKPFDYRGISDIDIGIGLDRFAYAEDIPAHLQSKDRVSIGSMGQKILSLSSLSIDKDRIRKEFKSGAAKKYVLLIESLEHIKVKGISLKQRGIHLQFFLLDNEIPVSKDMQSFQRKFIIYDRFSQPVVERQSQKAEQVVRLILEKELGKGNFDDDLIIEMIGVLSGRSYKDIKDSDAKRLGEKRGVAKKKMQKILREISNSL